MARTIDQIREEWQRALDAEDEPTVEALVREVLSEHKKTALAAEIRYHRGVITLMEGEGFGNERLGRALGEFRVGIEAAEALGPEAEPWRSLNRTQAGICLARVGNLKGAAEELLKVASYRPRSPMGLGALSNLVDLYLEHKQDRDARRIGTQKLSYARALHRDAAETPEEPYMRYLLAVELLDSAYQAEGRKILQELHATGREALGEELFDEVHESLESLQAG
jgi:hypothetical protein